MSEGRPCFTNQNQFRTKGWCRSTHCLIRKNKSIWNQSALIQTDANGLTERQILLRHCDKSQRECCGIFVPSASRRTANHSRHKTEAEVREPWNATSRSPTEWRRPRTFKWESLTDVFSVGLLGFMTEHRRPPTRNRKHTCSLQPESLFTFVRLCSVRVC